VVIVNGVVQTKDKPKVENVKVTVLVSVILAHRRDRSITVTHTLSEFFNHVEI
jgi:hypothetical protein